MKIFQKSENLPKIWKSFKNLKIFCRIKCLKGHKSLGSLYSVVNSLIVSGNRQSKGQTMSPIELFWTAKNIWLKKNYLHSCTIICTGGKRFSSLRTFLLLYQLWGHGQYLSFSIFNFSPTVRIFFIFHSHQL